jgi:hypothetical protein
MLREEETPEIGDEPLFVLRALFPACLPCGSK